MMESQFDKIMKSDDSDVELKFVHDVNGTPLCPGHPKICLGNGEFEGFECCCDECDHLMTCFPNWETDVVKIDLKQAEKNLDEALKRITMDEK